MSTLEDPLLCTKKLLVLLSSVVIALLLLPSFVLAGDVGIEPLDPTEVKSEVIEEVVVEETSYQKNFVCSAYYSPLPGQGRYATGTYAGDIRLNGSGVNGASGRAVFPGMVAAPRNYPFGTKMFIPGIGMTEVADRGGAIKGSRLDIWFGAGEEALLRALQFGKRSCAVTVYGLAPERQTEVSFGSIVVTGYTRQTVSNKPFTFNVALNEGDSGEAVARLQQFLKDLDFFNGEVNGEYGETTTNAVRDFQNQYGILKAASITTPGQFSGTTIDTLSDVVLGYRRDEYFLNLRKNLGKGDTGDSVLDLQKALLRLGYTLVVTGEYDEQTVSIVFRFQVDNDILKSSKDLGAGYFGPKTYNTLNKELITLENELESANMKKDEAVKKAVEVDSSALSFSGLAEGDSGNDVLLLQEELAALHYFGVEPTGYYGPLTSHAVFKLQQKLTIVKKKTDSGAGTVSSELADFLTDIRVKRFEYVSQSGMKNAGSSDGNIIIFSGKELKYGVVADDVRLLQAFLQKEGFFTGKLTTTYFGSATKRALIAYQIDRDLIITEADVSAGVFNQETQEIVLREMYEL